MKNRYLVVLTALVVMAWMIPVAVGEESSEGEELTVEEIIDRVTERNSLGFESGRAQIRMEVYDRAGERRERRLDVRSKRSEGRSRTLMSLTAPAEVQGQTFLFIENEGQADDMWMYVPAFDVTRRVEGSQRRSAFLGSHFTFADLESRDLREATYRRQADESIGEHEVYVIEARPKVPAESDYSRMVAYIRKSDQIPLRIRFFNKENEEEKTLFAERLNTTEAGVTYVEQMRLRSAQGGHTTIEIMALDPGLELPDSLFDRESLGR